VQRAPRTKDLVSRGRTKTGNGAGHDVLCNLRIKFTWHASRQDTSCPEGLKGESNDLPTTRRGGLDLAGRPAGAVRQKRARAIAGIGRADWRPGLGVRRQRLGPVAHDLWGPAGIGCSRQRAEPVPRSEPGEVINLLSARSRTTSTFRDCLAGRLGWVAAGRAVTWGWSHSPTECRVSQRGPTWRARRANVWDCARGTGRGGSELISRGPR
jgi:hypothetical protein